MKREDLTNLSVGTVTILTISEFVFTGSILRDKGRSFNSKTMLPFIGSETKVDTKTDTGTDTDRNTDTNTDTDTDSDTDTATEEEFITLRLTAPLLVIPGSGRPPVTQTIYAVGDTVQILEANIVSIGPAHS